jgi:cytochrome c2
MMPKALRILLLAIPLLASSTLSTAGLVPLPNPVAPDDLRISGLFKDTPGTTVKYLSRGALLRGPEVTHLNESPAESIAAADLTVIRLDGLLRALPTDASADGVVFICSDHWESFLPLEFINRVHPYILLKYDGKTPDQGWPMFGPTEHIAPYFCSSSTALGPKVDTRNEYGEFDATQIVEIRAANSKERYKPFYDGALAHLSPAASAGRKLFIRECNNCHQGPAGVGGSTSQRPFNVLQIHASFNPAYFRIFVTNPKKFYPLTVMPTHEYFTPEMMNSLIAFLSEARVAGVN